MAYTTEAIVRKESPFKNTSNIGATYIARAIAQADNIIDARLKGVYVLPLSETPDIIQNISTNLTFYELIKDQNLNIEVASGVNIQGLIDDAMGLLDMIAARKLKLLDSNKEELPVDDLKEPAYYPTQASTDAGVTEAQFTMNKQF